ncbi:hypothetical protein DPMN_031609 [Dreissena polymorpha]|uniref:Uncharacterized protein n=1 Tax=Dreissena polymorpha TaxID=45954 RepID=A0A9D4M2M6_DREPO|nr:hypothetical protein DPMN_031609 [Dreissena polymorpha]
MRKSRTVVLQAGQTCEETPSKTKYGWSPKRSRLPLMTRPDSQQVHIDNLPIKKHECNKVQGSKSHKQMLYLQNKFQFLKKNQKTHKLQGEWLGCEEEGCGFWGQSRCAGFFIPSRKSIPAIKFHDKHP